MTMNIPAQNYTFETFTSTLKELLRDHLRFKQGKLGLNFFTIDVEPPFVIHLLEDAGFEIEQQGEIFFLTYHYQRYGKEMQSTQYAYFYKSDPILIVFALTSMDYYDSPLRWIAENRGGIAHLKFYPNTFDELREKALSFSDTQILEFKGIKMNTFQSTGEKRPRIQKRRIVYEAIDGDLALEEIKYEYGVLPTRVTFWIPNKATFRVYEDGRFILKEGDYEFFKREIVDPVVESALQPVKEHKRAKLQLIDVEGRTEIERISIVFTISNEYSYESFDDFLSVLRKTEFFPFNEMKSEGSIIYRSFLSDERMGAVLSFYTDGKNFILSPKFGHGLHSLLRFYEFMLQEVDIKTKYVVK